MTDLATLQTMRAEAVAARHALALGNMVEGVTRDGRGTRYKGMSLDELNAYIDRLDRAIEAAAAQEQGRPRRGAIGFRWDSQ